MFRNVFGSIGISVGTALVQQSTQARSSYLSAWMTPLYPPFVALRGQYERTLTSLGRGAELAKQQATSQIYGVFREQSEVLAYHDVYLLFALAAFCVVPFGLFLRSQVGGGSQRAP
jgi:MFS transporter, DHA2 family, multidrug resistance protein